MNKNRCILQALLPGARIDSHASRISVHTGTSHEVIKINVGGNVFETFKSTLSAVPTSRLSEPAFLAKFYRHDDKDYFFDRDPAVFHCILNYFRSGELHLPTTVCGMVVKTELEFWGIDDTCIEECCWSRYANWSSTLQALRKLEDDQNSLANSWAFPTDDEASRLRLVRQKTWTFFSRPSSSKVAQVYAFTSVLVIFISIFSFCTSTLADFRIPDVDNNVFLNQTSNFTWEKVDSSNTNRTPYIEETKTHPALVIMDSLCLVFFSLELLARVLVTPYTIKFLVLPMTMVEFLAVAADLSDHLIRGASDETLVYVINFMKLLRVFRIFRLMRHIPGLWVLMYTVKASIKDLLLLFLFLLVGMLIFSSLIYFAENNRDSVFTSIPKCFWWSVVTMTTVGYGDLYPKTVCGYIVGAATGISGVLLIGFTVPVLVNNFIMYYNYARALRREDNVADSLTGRNYQKNRASSLSGSLKSDGANKFTDIEVNESLLNESRQNDNKH